ncbi:TetR family transcriptional regulator [Roseibium hamelinense]|uniref:TetR family transcriptional regulator n=1 Tax=Roseibium hamelinense TaxID=150831 RepID=A0A562TIY6_9HYPH|nr:TetR/AcrR family transcriptional regulator [Roseibium hamelinense]MTI45631.1 TetR/AcrR family transcriptional regulator [Roseibium hamelinense]TWI93188.1 TetR family transcriptional regulator [Roseibium hamelinense]
MSSPKTSTRRRAPSKKSLATKARILDAAESLFAVRGFDGTSIRDIAAESGSPVALVNHHGGPKEDLFHAVVARRAETLAELRLEALETRKAESGDLILREILSCFVRPFLHLAFGPDKGWVAYGRLIALVSADERWKEIAAECFDPTVSVFLDELSEICPNASRTTLSAAFVFMVSGMLALTSSSWRIGAVAKLKEETDLVEALLDYSEAGFIRLCGDTAR